MLEVLQFYVSGFWIWLGITTGLGLICHYLMSMVIGSVAALRGVPVHIGDVENNTSIKEGE